MEHFKGLMTTMAGAMQDLQIDTQAIILDLQGMSARSQHMEETLTVLATAFEDLASVVATDL